MSVPPQQKILATPIYASDDVRVESRKRELSILWLYTYYLLCASSKCRLWIDITCHSFV